MKLSVVVGLVPTRDQAAAIKRTLDIFTAAATFAVEKGRHAGITTRHGLHAVSYREIRTRFAVSAAIADAAVKRAAAVLEKTQGMNGAPRMDGRSFPINNRVSGKGMHDDGTVSLRLADSRIRLPFQSGDYQRMMLATRTNDSVLVERDGRFYLHITCNVEPAPPIDAQGWLGVDLGVVNLATTSDGITFSGDRVEAVRERHASRRQRLNREATRQRKRGRRPKNVRRALNRLGRKESRFRRDVNHCITKQVVALAQGTNRGIAVENLTGIRSRIRFAKPQRAKMGGWAFAQWQAFCAYKAQRAGVPFAVVNPAYTSQTCAVCGHCEKANRPEQASFVCQRCGHTAHADVNAAQNIAAKALVSAPKLAESPQKIAA